MAAEQQTLETIVELNYTDLQSGLNKIEKDIKAIATQTEKTLSTLSNERAIYKDLVNKNTELRNLQKDINKYKSGNITGNIKNNQTLTESVKKVALIKQYVKDLNSVIPKTASGFQAQNTQLDKIQEKFANLNREAISLKGHYKTIGSSTGLQKLDTQLSEIQKQQQIINTLNKKGLVNLTSDDLKSLDTAKTRYKELKSQVADTKAELSDVPVSGLATSAGLRALGYSALFAGLATGTQAIKTAIEYTLEYEQSVTKLGVILGVNSTKANELQRDIVDLTKAYGDSLAEINEVALSLGRAGVAFDEVAEATEAVVKLAKLTGDSVDTATGAVVSFIQVFGKDEFGNAIKTTEDLGAMIAFIANESKLSIQDINTLGNYALQTAKALNITENAIGAMSIALSNSGVNSSSLGTSIRRLQKIFTSTSPTVEKFFDSIGLNRQQLLLDFAKGGEESNEAFATFIETLSKVDASEFIKLTSGFDVLIKETLNQLKNNANPILDSFNDSFNVTNEELNKANKLAETNISVFKRFGNNLLDTGNKTISPLIDLLADLVSKLNEVQQSTAQETKSGFITPNYFDTVDIDKNISKIQELESTLVKLTSKDYSGNVAKELLDLQKTVNTSLSNIKFIYPSLKESEKAQLEEIVNQYEQLAKDIFSEFNVQDIFNTNLKKSNLSAQIFDLEVKAKFEGLDSEEKDLLKKLREIKNSIEKDSSSKIEIQAILNTTDVEALKSQGKALSQFYGSTSKDINTAISSNFDFMKSQLKKSLEDLNSNTKIKFDTELNTNNLSTEYVKVTQELFELQNNSKNLSGAELDIAKEDIISLEKKKELLKNVLDLQTFISAQEEDLADAIKAKNTAYNKQLTQQDEKTNKTIEQLVAQAKLDSKTKETSDLLALEIKIRDENLAKLVTEDAKQSALTKLLKLKLEYEKASTSETEKKNKALAKTEKIIQDEAIRVNTLLGYKDEELESEKALRELKSNSSFLKLSEEEQQAQVKVLENIIAQEQGYKGVSKAFTDYASQVPTLEEGLETLTSTGLQALEDGMVNFFDVTSDGFMDMKSMAKSVLTEAKSVLTEIYKELIRTLIVKRAVGFLTSGSTWSSIGSGIMSLFNANGGYIPDNLPNKQFAGGGILTGGSGVRDDLYLGSASGAHVFAMGGEYFTKKDSVNSTTKPMLDYINQNGTIPSVASSPTIVSTPTTINIENQTGTAIEADMIEELTKNNGNDEYEKVVSIMLKASSTDSRIRSKYNTN